MAISRKQRSFSSRKWSNSVFNRTYWEAIFKQAKVTTRTETNVPLWAVESFSTSARTKDKIASISSSLAAVTNLYSCPRSSIRTCLSSPAMFPPRQFPAISGALRGNHISHISIEGEQVPLPVIHRLV